MKRKPKKSEIILIGVLVATICFVMSLDSKVQRARARNVATQSAAENSVQPSLIAADNPRRRRPRVAASEVLPHWGMDPFDRRFAEGTTGADFLTDIDRPDTHEFYLHGIMIGPDVDSALINGRVLELGDTLAAFWVADISRERVVLRGVSDGEEKVLRLE